VDKNEYEDKKLEFAVTARTNIIYHNFYQRLYLWINNISTFFTLLLSSATCLSASDLLGKDVKAIYIITLGGIATILNGLLLAFQVPNQFYIHGDFKRQWLNVSDMVYKLDFIDDFKEKVNWLSQVQNEIHRISGSESPSNRKRLLASLKEAEQGIGLADSEDTAR